jgi:hypothetical protein
VTEKIPKMSRVIVHGGRHVHAVTRDEHGIQRTACGSRRLRACDRPQYRGEPITCPNCQKASRS